MAGLPRGDHARGGLDTYMPLGVKTCSDSGREDDEPQTLQALQGVD